MRVKEDRMNKNVWIGIGISVFNLLFYAAFLDIFFHSGIYPMVFGLDLLNVFGGISTSIGIAAIFIAIFFEVVSFRVIRRNSTFRSDVDNRD
jgi:hypothetical protein